LFGGAASVCDNEINNLPLIKVIVLYLCVGILFVAAALLFAFSKKVPSGKIEEVPEKAPKALGSLWMLTGLLIIAFIPVFSSYKGEAIDKVTAIKKTFEVQSTQVSNLKCEISGKTKEETEAIYKQIETIEATHKTQDEEVKAIMKPIEQKRFVWTLIALALVTIGLPILNGVASSQKKGWGAMQYPQLVYGMLAIFVYVGVEVAIGSNLGELLKGKDVLG
jgi:MFS transporter, FHS family, L-fucose permease